MSARVKYLKEERLYVEMCKTDDYVTVSEIFDCPNEKVKITKWITALLLLAKPCLKPEHVNLFYDEIQKEIQQMNLSIEDDAEKFIERFSTVIGQALNVRIRFWVNGAADVEVESESGNTAVGQQRTIFVILKNFSNSENDDEVEVFKVNHERLKHRLDLIMSKADFKAGLDESHGHMLDHSSIQIFPYIKDLQNNTLRRYSMSNSCEQNPKEFSANMTAFQIRRNRLFSMAKHTPNEDEMKMKHLARISLNYGYLQKDLSSSFYKTFLGKFYLIFKDEIDREGYRNFVNYSFPRLVDAFINPSTESHSVHQHFLKSSYEDMRYFMTKFQQFSFFNTDDQLMIISAADDHLNQDQKEGEKLVKYYEDHHLSMSMEADLYMHYETLKVQKDKFDDDLKLVVDGKNLLMEQNQQLIQILGDENEKNKERKENLKKILVEREKEKERVKKLEEQFQLNEANLKKENLLVEKKKNESERNENSMKVELKKQQKVSKAMKENLTKEQEKMEMFMKQSEENKKKTEEVSKSLKEDIEKENICNAKLKYKAEINAKKLENFRKKAEDEKKHNESLRAEVRSVKVGQNSERNKELENLVSENKILSAKLDTKTAEALKEKLIQENLKKKSEETVRALEEKITKVSNDLKQENQENIDQVKKDIECMYTDEMKDLRTELGELKEDERKLQEKVYHEKNEKEKVEQNMFNQIEIMKENCNSEKEETKRIMQSQITLLEQHAKKASVDANCKINELKRKQTENEDSIKTTKYKLISNNGIIQGLKHVINNQKENISKYDKKIQEQTLKIEDQELQNKNKLELDFVRNVKQIADQKINEKKLVYHKIQFGPKKEVYIRIKPYSKSYISSCLKLAIETSTKMLSSSTTNGDTLRQKLSLGRKQASALMILDDKLKGCFLQFIEPESVDILRNMISCIESFYQIKIQNISTCLDICRARFGSCNNTKTKLQNIEDQIIKQRNVNLECNDETISFKEYLISLTF